MRDFKFSIRLPGSEPMEFSGGSAILALVVVSFLTMLIFKFALGVILSLHTLLLIVLVAVIVYAAHRSGGFGALIDRFRR